MRASPAPRRLPATPPRSRSLLAIIAITALVLLGACHRPSLKDRARAMGGGIARVGAKVVALVKPVVPDVDIQALAVASVKQAAHARVDQAVDQAAPQPLTFQKTYRADGRGRSKRAEAPAPATDRPAQPAPNVTVTRIDASKPTLFVLRGQTHGGKQICEAYPTKDECVTTCTSKLRMNAFSKPTAGSITSCSCLEQDDGC
jgi:hypothetical protein